MGVDGLWSLLAPAGECRSFNELTISQFERDSDYVLGVDASLWLVQCSAVFRYNHHNAGENPEMRTLFYRLCHLLRLHLHVIFVFDGMNRAETKRGKKVKKTPHWLENAFVEMLTLFGFAVHKAPAEAEAELARMNRLCIISAVLSDDVDTFLFGAFAVIRNPNLKANEDNVQFYSAGSINQVTHLSRGGMILIAILCGGDYEKNGLKGCGINIAYGLAKYDLGDSLLRAAKMHCDDAAALASFLADWRVELRILLRTDPDGHIGRQCKSVADNISETFPLPHVVLAYTHPLTSWSHGGYGAAAIPSVPLQEPDVRGLASFCKRHFGWSPEMVRAKFESVLWEGACLRMLGQSEHKRGRFSPTSVLKVVTRRTLSASAKSVIMYRLSVEARHLVHLTDQGISDVIGSFSISGAPAKFNVWIPLPIVRRALPALVKKGDEGAALAASSPSPVIDLTDIDTDIVIFDLSGTEEHNGSDSEIPGEVGSEH